MEPGQWLQLVSINTMAVFPCNPLGNPIPGAGLARPWYGLHNRFIWP